MSNKRIFTLCGVSLVMILLVLAACSSNDPTENEGFVERQMDTVSVAVTETPDPVDLTVSEQVQSEELIESSDPVWIKSSFIRTPSDLTDMVDLIVVGDSVISVSSKGLVLSHRNSGEYELIESEDPLNVIYRHDSRTFVGGDNLYEFKDGELRLVEAGLTGVVTALGSYGPNLMVGTTAGLYARTVIGTVPLLDGIDVSALVADNDGLWVGTAGQGLYRYNGDEFVKRYLTRDRSLFDNITALAFNHDHLYLGTADAFFVYDGGKWQELTNEDGLPSGNIRSIDASDWVVYVATDRGIASWFENSLTLVEKLETQPAEKILRDRHRLFLGTAKDGLLLKSGPSVRSLTDSAAMTEEILSVTP